MSMMEGGLLGASIGGIGSIGEIGGVENSADAAELLNPMARAMPLGGMRYHKERLVRLLKEADMFRDPMRGLPQY